MRLPLTPALDTKDGLSNKNARLTNCLKEVKKTGEKVVVRPGLVLDDTYTGIGSGLIPFDGRLLVIYDDTVTDTDGNIDPWPLDSPEWDGSYTYGYGDATWYLGSMWFSQNGSNTGNTPGSGTSWERSVEYAPYDSGTVYPVNSYVLIGGTRYYSMNPYYSGYDPEGTEYLDQIMWSTTPATNLYAVTGFPNKYGSPKVAAIMSDLIPGPGFIGAFCSAAPGHLHLMDSRTMFSSYVELSVQCLRDSDLSPLAGAAWVGPYYYTSYPL